MAAHQAPTLLLSDLAFTWIVLASVSLHYLPIDTTFCPALLLSSPIYTYAALFATRLVFWVFTGSSPQYLDYAAFFAYEGRAGLTPFTHFLQHALFDLLELFGYLFSALCSSLTWFSETCVQPLVAYIDHSYYGILVPRLATGIDFAISTTSSVSSLIQVNLALALQRLTRILSTCKRCITRLTSTILSRPAVVYTTAHSILRGLTALSHLDSHREEAHAQLKMCMETLIPLSTDLRSLLNDVEKWYQGEQERHRQHARRELQQFHSDRPDQQQQPGLFRPRVDTESLHQLIDSQLHQNQRRECCQRRASQGAEGPSITEPGSVG